MKKPELLSDTDKYIFDVNEFNIPLDRFIFSAIYNLFINGAEVIHTVDIDNYLQQNKYAKDLMENENGISFLQDCEAESEINNILNRHLFESIIYLLIIFVKYVFTINFINIILRHL